jgi:hypothetical protein
MSSVSGGNDRRDPVSEMLFKNMMTDNDQKYNTLQQLLFPTSVL